jgi:RimJ/RimL family protein N-acetyltransferase
VERVTGTAVDAPILHTPRCLVRPLRAADLAELARYRSDPHVARYQSWTTYTVDEARELLEELAVLSFATPDTWYQLAIARAADDLLVGDIGVHFVDEHQVELGFTLAQEHHGQGFAREAVAAVLDHLFGALHRHRCFAIIDERNASARRLLEALGFRREAHHVDNVLFKGEWGSEYVYAILRREHARGR